MSLTNSILSSKPREESGSKVSRKYAFQHTLSLFLLLKSHHELHDYVFMFDFHDDLVILDSSSDPQSLNFYQIKSKDKGYWSVRDLTKRDQTNSSIIGKMYHNKLAFPKNTLSLNFISNARFKFKQISGSIDSVNQTSIHAYQLQEEDIASFVQAIQEQHQITGCDDFKSIAAFLVTDLSNADSETHCEGELSKLIYSLNPSNAINAHLAYTQISAEVRRKANNTISDKTINDLGELIELKGISKDYFLTLLKKAGLYESIATKWSDIRVELVALGMPTMEMRKYKKAYQDVETILIKDVNQIPLQQLVTNIKTTLLDLGSKIHAGSTPADISLLQVVDYCQSKIDTTINHEYDDYFIKALIIKHHYDE